MTEEERYWDRQFRLELVAKEIGDYLRFWYRMDVRQTKAKWDTVRVYCDFGIYDLHSLIYPGYVFTQKSFHKNPLKFINKYTRFFFTMFSGIVTDIQALGYARAYRKACKKYPELDKHILEGADHRDYLEDIYLERNIKTNWSKL